MADGIYIRTTKKFVIKREYITFVEARLQFQGRNLYVGMISTHTFGGERESKSKKVGRGTVRVNE